MYKENPDSFKTHEAIQMYGSIALAFEPSQYVKLPREELEVHTIDRDTFLQVVSTIDEKLIESTPPTAKGTRYPDLLSCIELAIRHQERFNMELDVVIWGYSLLSEL